MRVKLDRAKLGSKLSYSPRVIQIQSIHDCLQSDRDGLIVINTESGTKSNLTSVILKRNLYQLGLEYPTVDRHGGTIDRLVGVRNAIAHGDALKNPNESEAKDYVAAAFVVMRFVQNEVYGALQKKVYRRTPEETIERERQMALAF